MNRHQEACEEIWDGLKKLRKDAEKSGTLDLYVALYGAFEEILTLTESRVQDDLEDQYQSIPKEEDGPYAHV